ncbi:MAG: biotin/lipoate A/B protein ligase family protein [Candidatus Thermoplasmatota archaeon]|nr:biotin/lipoate A/B protein ligase family protein [Candidatus Thermoplasmatota archaeon]
MESEGDFRSFLDGYCTPAENMARDETLLRRVIAKGSAPCVRFYQWKPAGLSIGRFQKIDEGVDLKACKVHGVEVVRRLTGGEAVLHDNEITYSIIIPLTHPDFDGRGVIDTYKTISRALVKGLELTGVRSTIAGEAPTRPDPGGQGVCFYTPTVNEIVADHRKIIGSAQTRDKLVIMQHGSIPIDWDIDKQFDVMAIPKEKREVFTNLFRNRATTIVEQLGSIPSFEKLSGNFSKGFEEVFNTRLVQSDYSVSEIKMTRWLVQKKYECDDWNLKL